MIEQMTCREWMEKNKPLFVKESYFGGVANCPHYYELRDEKK